MEFNADTRWGSIQAPVTEREFYVCPDYDELRRDEYLARIRNVVEAHDG